MLLDTVNDGSLVSHLVDGNLSVVRSVLVNITLDDGLNDVMDMVVNILGDGFSFVDYITITLALNRLIAVTGMETFECPLILGGRSVIMACGIVCQLQFQNSKK